MPRPKVSILQAHPQIRFINRDLISGLPSPVIVQRWSTNRWPHHQFSIEEVNEYKLKIADSLNRKKQDRNESLEAMLEDDLNYLRNEIRIGLASHRDDPIVHQAYIDRDIQVVQTIATILDKWKQRQIEAQERSAARERLAELGTGSELGAALAPNGLLNGLAGLLASAAGGGAAGAAAGAAMSMCVALPKAPKELPQLPPPTDSSTTTP